MRKSFDIVSQIIRRAGYTDVDVEDATCGLCGTFALALKRHLAKLGIESQLYVFAISDDKEEPGYFWQHVAINVNGRFYDIRGRINVRNTHREFNTDELIPVSEAKLLPWLRMVTKENETPAYSHRALKHYRSKMVSESFGDIPRMWLGPNGESINLDDDWTTHYQYVLDHPEVFDVDHLGGTSRQITSVAQQNGWVRISHDTSGGQGADLAISANSHKDAQRALRWLFKNRYMPSSMEVEINGPSGEVRDFFALRDPLAIDDFYKNRRQIGEDYYASPVEMDPLIGSSAQEFFTLWKEYGKPDQLAKAVKQYTATIPSGAFDTFKANDFFKSLKKVSPKRHRIAVSKFVKELDRIK